ncbi:MAG: hypothetical protein ABI175_06210, partial [Polyangiales bacterium]
MSADEAAKNPAEGVQRPSREAGRYGFVAASSGTSGTRPRMRPVLRVLVVEDDPMIASCIVEALAMSGH